MDVRFADRIGTRLSRPRLAPSEWLAVGGIGAAGAAFALSPDGIEDGPVICPFRLLTGLPCPGCGLTRAWVYLAHGQWSDSLLANPFGIVSVALVVALVVAVVVARVGRAPAPDLQSLVRRPWLRALLVVWLGFAAVRIVVLL
jgi:hypothetical protein